MFPDLLRDDVFRLETRRLWLRWPQAADAAEIVRLAGDADVAGSTARIPHPYPSEAATAFVLQTRRENSDGKAATYMLTAKNRPNAPLGAIGLTPLDGQTLELGYWLGKPYWQQGLMTEAALAIIELVFTWTATREIVAAALADNTASQKVLENIGFQLVGPASHEAPARGGPRVANCFSLRRGEWLASAAATSAFLQRQVH